MVPAHRIGYGRGVSLNFLFVNVDKEKAAKLSQDIMGKIKGSTITVNYTPTSGSIKSLFKYKKKRPSSEDIKDVSRFSWSWKDVANWPFIHEVRKLYKGVANWFKGATKKNKYDVCDVNINAKIHNKKAEGALVSLDINTSSYEDGMMVSQDEIIQETQMKVLKAFQKAGGKLIEGGKHGGQRTKKR